MPTRHEEIDDIMVLVDVEDPMTYDEEFINRIRYSESVIGHTEFSDASRVALKLAADGDPMTDNKFLINIYTDRFPEFILYLMHDHKHQRSLIFRKETMSGPVPDIDPEDIDDDEMFGIMQRTCSITQIYELKTVGLIPDNYGNPDDEDDDEDEEHEHDESEGTESAAEPTEDETQMMADLEAQAEDFVESRVAAGSFYLSNSNKNVH